MENPVIQSLLSRASCTATPWLHRLAPTRGTLLHPHASSPPANLAHNTRWGQLVKYLDTFEVRTLNKSNPGGDTHSLKAAWFQPLKL